MASFSTHNPTQTCAGTDPTIIIDPYASYCDLQDAVAPTSWQSITLTNAVQGTDYTAVALTVTGSDGNVVNGFNGVSLASAVSLTSIAVFAPTRVLTFTLHFTAAVSTLFTRTNAPQIVALWNGDPVQACVTSGSSASSQASGNLTIVAVAPPPSVWQYDTTNTITWTPALISQSTVDVSLWSYDPTAAAWSLFQDINRAAANNGNFSFSISSSLLQLVRGIDGLYTFHIRVSGATQALVSDIFTFEFTSPSFSDAVCARWAASDPGTGTYTSSYPACPCTLAQAQQDPRFFETDPLCHTPQGVFHPRQSRL